MSGGLEYLKSVLPIPFLKRVSPEKSIGCEILPVTNRLDWV